MYSTLNKIGIWTFLLVTFFAKQLVIAQCSSSCPSGSTILVNTSNWNVPTTGTGVTYCIPSGVKITNIQSITPDGVVIYNYGTISGSLNSFSSQNSQIFNCGLLSVGGFSIPQGTTIYNTGKLVSSGEVNFNGTNSNFYGLVGSQSSFGSVVLNSGSALSVSGIVNVLGSLTANSGGNINGGVGGGTLSVSGSFTMNSGSSLLGPSLTITPVPSTSSGVVIGSGVLSMFKPSIVTSAPNFIQLCAGTNTTLSVLATVSGSVIGGPNYTYEWQIQTITNGAWLPIAASSYPFCQGITNPTLTMTGVPVSASGYFFRVKVIGVPASNFITSPNTNFKVLKSGTSFTVNITTTSPSGICPNTPVLITATTDGNSSNGFYKWMRNGFFTSTNSVLGITVSVSSMSFATVTANNAILAIFYDNCFANPATSNGLNIFPAAPAACQGSTTYTWVGTTSSAWSNSLNWSPSTGVPTSTDDVIITTTGSSVSLGGDVVVRNFTLRGRAIDLSSFTLSITGIATISTNSSIVGGGSVKIDDSNSAYGVSSVNLFGTSINSSAIISIRSMIVNITNSIINSPSISINSFTQNLTTNTINGALNVTIPANADNSNAWWGGANIFNSSVTLNNYAPTKNFSPNYPGTAPSSYNGDWFINNYNTNSLLGFSFSFGYHSPNFPIGNIYVNNSYGTVYLGYSSYASLKIPVNKQISVSGWNGGTLYLNNVTTLGANLFTVSLLGISTLNISNSYFNSSVNFASNDVIGSFSQFNGSLVPNSIVGINSIDLSSSNFGSGCYFSSKNVGLTGNYFSNASVPIYINSFAQNLTTNTINGALNVTIPTNADNSNAFWGGANIFNSSITLNNYSPTKNFSSNYPGTSPSSYNGDWFINNYSTNTLIGFGFSFGYHNPNSAIGNIYVNNSYGNIYLGYSNWAYLNLPVGKQISITGWSGGTLSLINLTSPGTNLFSLALPNSSSLVVSNSKFNSSLFTVSLPGASSINLTNSSFGNSVNLTANNITGSFSQFNGSLVPNSIVGINSIDLSSSNFGSGCYFSSKNVGLTGNYFSNASVPIYINSFAQNLTTNTINGALNVTIPANADNSNAFWGGANIFNSSITLNNYSPTKNFSSNYPGTSPSSYNGDWYINNFNTNTLVGFVFSFGYHNPSSTIGNIYINNTYGNIYLGYVNRDYLTIPVNKQISVTGWSGGSLTFYNVTTLGTTIPLAVNLPSNTTLNITNSLFNNPISINAGSYALTNNTFSNSCDLIRSNYPVNSYSGGNTFNGALNITEISTSAGNLLFGSSNRDVYNSKVNVRQYSKGTIYFAYNTLNNLFNDDINLYYTTSGGGISFGNGTNGTTSLLGINSRFCIKKENPNDRNVGSITLNRLYKESTLSNNWGDANDGSFNLNDVYINGDLNLKAQNIALTDGTFTGICSFDLNGNGSGWYWNCYKNTIFGNDISVVHNSPYSLNVANGSGKYVFQGNVNFTRNGNGFIGVGNSDFYKNLSYLSNATLPSTGFSWGGIARFLGTEDQNINLTYVPGTNLTLYSGFYISKMEVNKPTGNVITNNTIGIDGGYLNLVNGKIICNTGTNIGVFFYRNCSLLGGNFNSFVDGSITNAVNTPFTFHVGVGDRYMPVTVSAPPTPSGYNANVTIKPMLSSPPSSTSLQSPLKDLVMDQYWEISNYTYGSVPPASLTLNWNSTNNLKINKNVLAFAVQTGTAPWVQYPANVSGDNNSGSITNTITFPFATYAFTSKTFKVGFGYLSKVDINTTNLRSYNYTINGSLESNLPTSFTSGADGTNNGIVTLHPDLNSDVQLGFNLNAQSVAGQVKFTLDANSSVTSSLVQYFKNGSYINLPSNYYTINNGGSSLRFLTEIPIPSASAGLVSYLPFRNSINDDLNNLQNPLINGVSFTRDRFCKQNEAIWFDDTEDFVQFDQPATNKLKDWTISAWIRPADLSSTGIALLNGYDKNCAVNGTPCDANGYAIGINGGKMSYLQPNVTDWANSTFAFTGTTQWALVTVTRDINSTIKYYVNGDLQDSFTGTADPQAPTAFILGRQQYPNQLGVNPFKGAIDEVRVYDRALSASEITDLYDGPQLYCEGPLASYSFCNNGLDKSGFGYTATIMGAVPAPNRFGQKNSAYYFDQAPSNPNYIIAPAPYNKRIFTASYWMKPDSSILSTEYPTGFSLKEDLIDPYNASFVSLLLGSAYPESDQGKIANCSYTPSNQQTCLTGSNGALSLGEWHHIAYTYDASNKVALYVDGAFVSEQFINGKDQKPYNYLFLGKENLTPEADGNKFKGTLDDFEIYNWIMSPEEIQELYRKTLDCGSVSYPDVPRIGMVAWYPFTGDASDMSGNWQIGTANEVAPTTDRFKNGNSAYLFNGQTSYVDAYNIPSSTLNENFTISLWFKSLTGDTTSHNQSLLSFLNNSNIKVYDIAYNKPNASINFFDAANGARPSSLSSSNFFNDWTHLAIVQNNGLASYYINGVIQQDGVPIINLTNTDNYRLVMGGLPSNGQSLNGALDDIIIYKRALSIKEINQIFTGNVIGSSLSVYLGKDKKNIGYSIVNNSGQTVHTGAIPGEETFLDLSFLPEGSYLFKLAGSTDDFRFIKK